MNLKRERTRHELLHEDLQIIMLELTKIPRVTDKTTDDMKLLWMQFFSSSGADSSLQC